MRRSSLLSQLGPNAVRVAAITAIGLVVLLIFVLISSSRDTFQLKAIFDDVRGLIPGGDVTAGAQVVGSVTEVELNEAGDPEVTMEIDPDFKMHQGAIANIRLASNVGAVNRTVDLTEGDPTLPEIEDGATLSGARTDNPVDFDLAVSTLRPKVRGNIREMLIGLDEALLNRGPDFDRTLRHSALALGETARLLAQVNEDGESLRTLVTQGRRVVGALAQTPEDLGGSVENLAALLGAAGGRQSELARATEDIGPALAEGGDLLDRVSESVPTLRELIDGAGPLVEELGPFAKLVPPATRVAGPFLHQTKKLVREAPDQLRRQAGLVKIGPPLLERVGPMLDRLNPIADWLRVWTPETVGFFQNVADSTASYDVNGHAIRTTTGVGNVLAPTTLAGGEIGPSECSPGLLEAPFYRTPGVNECQPWDDWRSTAIGGGD
jgi:virulence factor Mce-like protein